jgi:hypothetical protein
MKIKKPIKLIRYLNPVAQMHLIATSPYKVIIAGRGFSKSFGNGLSQSNKVALMPKSLGLFTSPTYSMIYTKTLIPMKSAWEQHCGYYEGLHYVVGKVPPKHFEKPYHRPHRYENVVSFWNGRSIVFGSFDRPALMSGGSYDDVDNDEAYLFDKDDYDNFVIPTVRGTHASFRDCPIHLQQSFSSSMPFKHQGDWLLEFYAKSKTNPEMYSFIGWEPNAKVQMGSTWMNRLVLGDKAILQMKAEMDPYAYSIMILNQQVTNFGNTFYPALGPQHWYRPLANDKVISLPLDKLSTYKRDASYDEGPDDYNPTMPLHISHDWGKFNCITIDQEYPKEVRVINAMHVNNPRVLDDLANDFCEYYRMHKAKLVYQWGDKSGTHKQVNSKLNLFEQFAEKLRDKGWRVILKKTGDVDQMERHRFISNLHSENDQRLPRVRYNANNCADLRIALESTGMMPDGGKDKRSERNDSVKPEHSTHYTDAHDYRLYHAFRQRESKDSLDHYATSLH